MSTEARMFLILIHIFSNSHPTPTPNTCLRCSSWSKLSFGRFPRSNFEFFAENFNSKLIVNTALHIPTYIHPHIQLLITSTDDWHKNIDWYPTYHRRRLKEITLCNFLSAIDWNFIGETAKWWYYHTDYIVQYISTSVHRHAFEAAFFIRNYCFGRGLVCYLCFFVTLSLLVPPLPFGYRFGYRNIPQMLIFREYSTSFDAMLALF